MLSFKKSPIISKRIYKSEPAFSDCKVEWIMSLLGIMIIIGYQSEIGLEKYAWKKEGSLYNPACTAAPAAWMLNTSSVGYLRTGRLALMDFYNHPIAFIYGDGADGLVSHAQLTRALYAQAQDELVPTSSSLSRTSSN